MSMSIRTVMTGSQIFEIWSRDPGHSHLRVACGPDAVGVRLLYLCQFSSR